MLLGVAIVNSSVVIKGITAYKLYWIYCLCMFGWSQVPEVYCRDYFDISAFQETDSRTTYGQTGTCGFLDGLPCWSHKDRCDCSSISSKWLVFSVLGTFFGVFWGAWGFFKTNCDVKEMSTKHCIFLGGQKINCLSRRNIFGLHLRLILIECMWVPQDCTVYSIKK